MTLVNLEITFYLASPVVLSYPWLSIDGYIAYEVGNHQFGERWHELQADPNGKFWDELNVPLKRVYFEDRWIYAASIGRCTNSITSSKKIYKEFPQEGLQWNASKKRSYQIVGGQFKLREIKHPTLVTPSITFWCTGDPLRIRECCNNIISLGKRVASGNGRVTSVDITRVDADYSLLHPIHGVNRPIPIPLAARLHVTGEVALLSSKPPYWAKRNHEECIIPGGFT